LVLKNKTEFSNFQTEFCNLKNQTEFSLFEQDNLYMRAYTIRLARLEARQRFAQLGLTHTWTELAVDMAHAWDQFVKRGRGPATFTSPEDYDMHIAAISDHRAAPSIIGAAL
jgi:hypothetical protein